jgi:5'-3' exonuclease
MSYKTLLLDLPSIYYRAFYALPESITNEAGQPANAIRGSLSIINTITTDYAAGEIIAALDIDWRPQWRVKLLPQYKANRVVKDDHFEQVDETPDSLSDQIPHLIEILKQLNVKIVGKSNYEADDCLSTLATNNTNALIVTGDKDLLQLINKKNRIDIYLLSDKTNPIWNFERFVKHFGFEPAQYLDYAVLRGDPSDGLPGVSKVGEKTAMKLIQEFQSIDNLLIHLSKNKSDKMPVGHKNILSSQPYLKNALKVSQAVSGLKLDIKAEKPDPKKLETLKLFFRVEKQVDQFEKNLLL